MVCVNVDVTVLHQSRNTIDELLIEDTENANNVVEREENYNLSIENLIHLLINKTILKYKV